MQFLYQITCVSLHYAVGVYKLGIYIAYIQILKIVFRQYFEKQRAATHHRLAIFRIRFLALCGYCFFEFGYELTFSAYPLYKRF